MQNNVKDYLEQQKRIKEGMQILKNKATIELGTDQVPTPFGDSDNTSRSIGIQAGPVGGVIVKDLIAQGEQALMQKYGKDE